MAGRWIPRHFDVSKKIPSISPWQSDMDGIFLIYSHLLFRVWGLSKWSYIGVKVVLFLRQVNRFEIFAQGLQGW